MHTIKCNSISCYTFIQINNKGCAIMNDKMYRILILSCMAIMSVCLTVMTYISFTN
nr:MAG TPA: hypothetical protein [Caudoviricetes sp.]